MDNPVKRVPKEKVAILHICEQKENIRKINEMLVGNGHPEDGLAFKVRRMYDTSEEIKKQVGEIREKLSSVAEVNTELEIQRRISIKVSELKNIKLDKGVKVAGIFIAALILISSFFLGVLNYQHTRGIPGLKTEVDMINTPVRTRDGSIQWWPSGVVIDSIKLREANK